MRELLGKERPLGDGLRMGGLAPGTGCMGKKLLTLIMSSVVAGGIKAIKSLDSAPMVLPSPA